MEVKKKIRVNYAPLSFAVSVECVTPDNPVTQVYDSVKRKYEPDRELSATVLRPIVKVNCNDGTWSDEKTLENISGVQWFVNGADASLSTTVGFEVLNNSNRKMEEGYDYGDLAINRNLTAGTSLTLVFRCVLVDPRTNTSHQLFSEPVILSTTVKAMDQYLISIDSGALITYNPFEDKKLFYDYRKAKGLLAEGEEAPPYDFDKCYLKNITFSVYKGGKITTMADRANLVFKLFKIGKNAGGARTEAPVTAASGDVAILGMSAGKLSIDMRHMFSYKTYIIRGYLKNEDGSLTPIAEREFTVQRLRPKYEIEILGADNVDPSTNAMEVEVVARYRGRKIKNPEAVLDITLGAKSDTNPDGIYIGDGARATLNLADLSLGETVNDSNFEVTANALYKNRLTPD